jgi:hypothetical protein
LRKELQRNAKTKIGCKGEWRCENFERMERFETWNYEQLEFKGATPCTRQREAIKESKGTMKKPTH